MLTRHDMHVALPICPTSGSARLSCTAADTSAEVANLVGRVQVGDSGGMSDLYEYILIGLRPYLSRQLRPQDYRDKVHSIFVDVVVAIQRGQLRKPERLLGFARTIARRKVSSYIDEAASGRRSHVEIGSLFGLASPRATPEEEMVLQQQREIVRLTLARLSEREGEILTRFYLQEQTEVQICLEMGLTHTQYRLLKWRSKARFAQLSRKETVGRYLQALCAAGPQ